jgi:hypothetical protein
MAGSGIPARLVGPEYRYPQERFFHIDDWREGRTSHRSPGWRTTQATRGWLIADLGEAINERGLILHDQETKTELDNFVQREGGRFEAQKGFHDDRVFALGMGVQGVKHYPAFESTSGDMIQKLMAARADSQATADEVTGY